MLGSDPTFHGLACQVQQNTTSRAHAQNFYNHTADELLRWEVVGCGREGPFCGTGTSKAQIKAVWYDLSTSHTSVFTTTTTSTTATTAKRTLQQHLVAHIAVYSRYCRIVRITPGLYDDEYSRSMFLALAQRWAVALPSQYQYNC